MLQNMLAWLEDEYKACQEWPSVVKMRILGMENIFGYIIYIDNIKCHNKHESKYSPDIRRNYEGRNLNGTVAAIAAEEGHHVHPPKIIFGTSRVVRTKKNICKDVGVLRYNNEFTTSA